MAILKRESTAEFKRRARLSIAADEEVGRHDARRGLPANPPKEWGSQRRYFYYAGYAAVDKTFRNPYG